MIVASLMSKRQIFMSNLVKVDCCLNSGGDLFHPWRLMRVSTLGDCCGGGEWCCRRSRLRRWCCGRNRLRGSSLNCLIHIAKYSFFIAATLRFLYP
jgi:hypothetical protein